MAVTRSLTAAQRAPRPPCGAPPRLVRPPAQNGADLSVRHGRMLRESADIGSGGGKEKPGTTPDEGEGQEAAAVRRAAPIGGPGRLARNCQARWRWRAPAARSGREVAGRRIWRPAARGRTRAATMCRGAGGAA